MLPLVLMVCGADPSPQFVVENKCPAFTVVNRMPAAPVTPALPTDPSKPAPAGYEWRKYGNDPWKLFPIDKAAEVAVPVKGSTFRGNVDGHQCPACGRSQYVVDGFNRNGTHNHRCPVDGTVWSH